MAHRLKTKIIFAAIYCAITSPFFYSQLASAESNNCTALFNQNFISTEEKINSTIKNLAELKMNLDIAKAKGTSSVELTALADNFKSKSSEFYKYIRKNDVMTKEQYLERIKQEIAMIQNKSGLEKTKDARNREDQIEEFKNVTINGTRLITHRIELDPNPHPDTASITKAYDMAATQTTQIIWKKVAELAHSKFPEKYYIDPDPSEFKGDTRPVEMVSFKDIQIWIEALNELSQNGESSLADFIPNHKAGDAYRLPTEDEWVFVVRGRNQINSIFHFGNNMDELNQYAWYDKNSKKETRPVATREPLVIEKKEFYDMHGNVWEFVTTPDDNSSHTILRGGSWLNQDRELQSTTSFQTATIVRKPYYGFRLVREAR